MHLAGQPVMQSVIPNSRVLGVPDNVGREDVLSFARRYGVNSVAVCRPGLADSWYGYLRVVDVALTPSRWPRWCAGCRSSAPARASSRPS